MIARKAFLILSSTFFINILGIVGVMVLAKLWGELSVIALGSIGFALSTIMVFNILGDLGFGSAHIKRVSQGENLGTCIGTYIVIRMFLMLLVLSSVFIGVYVLGGGITDATSNSVFLIIIIYMVFSSLRTIPLHTFTGKQEIAKRQMMLLFENLVKLPLLVFVALLLIDFYPVESLAFTYVSGMMATFLVGLYLFRRYPVGRPSWVMFKSYFVFALPLAFSSMVVILTHNVDKVMIGYFWTSMEVGYYFVVQRITGVVLILATSVNTVLFPLISSFHSSKKYKEITDMMFHTERYSSMVLVPPMIFLLLFSYPIVEILLDAAYLPGVSVLMVLSIWVYMYGVSLPYTSLLIGMNHPKMVSLIGISMCMVNIGLNYLLIPSNGLLSSMSINGPLGAAVGTMCAGFVVLVGTRIVVRKLIDIKILHLHTLKHLFAGLVMGVFLYGLDFYVKSFYWYHLLLFALLGLLVYVLLLVVMQEFNRKDWSFFCDVLNPWKTFGYVKSELNDNYGGV